MRYLLFNMKRGNMQILHNLCEKVVFNKISGLHHANMIQKTHWKVVLKHFAYVLGTVNLSNNSFLLAGQDQSIAYTILCRKSFVPNLVIFVVIQEWNLQENICSEFFERLTF